MYLPMVGLAIMLAWGVADALRRLPRLKTAVAVLASAALVWWAVLTGEQIQYWKNSQVLYQHALDVTQQNSRAHYFLGSDLIRIPGRLPEGIDHLEAALRITPDYASAHTNLAGALLRIPGGLPRAVAHYEAALRIWPDSADAHYNLGVTLASVPGRLPEAISHLETALRINPNDEATRQALRRLRAARP
jgi:tetratricopeptide (TPR) repeat protein